MSKTDDAARPVGWDDPIRKLLCIAGRPRTGTTSAAGEIDRSPLCRIWIEKDLWTEDRTYSSLEDLAREAAKPGGKIPMAIRYNQDVVAAKKRCEVLGDKTTWIAPVDHGKDSIERILDSLSRTAAALDVAHELVACVRDPLTWLPAWAMTHFLRTAGPDMGFWAGMTGEPSVRALLQSKLDGYAAHLAVVERLASDPAVTVRCMEMRRVEELYYRFDFADYVSEAAPDAFRRDPWPSILAAVKKDLERAVVSGWIDHGEAPAIFGALRERHRPCEVAMGDGTTRRL